jgi:hypothetical protein
MDRGMSICVFPQVSTLSSLVGSFYQQILWVLIRNLYSGEKGKGKGRFGGPIQHCSLKADCTLAPEIVPSFIFRGAPHQAAWEASTSEGRKLNTQILPAPRNLPQVLGSFTCPKVGTRGRLFNFPSEGRHAEDFYIWKIQRFQPGLNPRTREPEASMLTTRPLKPSTQAKVIYKEQQANM